MYNRLDDVLDDAQKNEVNKVICIGTDVNTSKKSVDIANKYDCVLIIYLNHNKNLF
jgi:TatD DNase family protein